MGKGLFIDRHPCRIARGQGGGVQRRMEMTANRNGGSFLGDSSVLGLSAVIAVQLCEYTKSH